jgi:tRNA pseudouridine13 synthase
VTSPLPVRARFRVAPEDFEVEELLGFEPDGPGEHLFLWIEKRGANTPWVAGELARWAGVAPMAVSYSGMKDRHAVTRQWFNVHLPKRIAPDDDPVIEGVRVLRRAWHSRKLKRGAHRGNRFTITLRDVEGDLGAAETMLARIAVDGVPNAFGDQRFGRDAGNLEEARRWLSADRPARLPHTRRGLLLSAARSHLFNRVLHERVRRGDWNRALPGDCFQLDGSGSWFGPEAAATDELVARAARGDIHPTGPLWGAGDPPTAAEAHAIEMAVAAGEPVFAAGLARFDLRQERRSLRLIPQNFSWQWAAIATLISGTSIVAESAGRLSDEAIHPHADTGKSDSSNPAHGTTLRLSFELPSGTFATAVLAAFCELEDASRLR